MLTRSMDTKKLKDTLRRDIPLLLAHPPDPLPPEFIVESIVDGKYRLSTQDKPELPFWQTQDLELHDYHPPWLARQEYRWDTLSLKESIHQDNVANGIVRRFMKDLRKPVHACAPTRKYLCGCLAPIALRLSSAIPRSGFHLTDVDRVIMAAMVVFDMGMLVASDDQNFDAPPVPAKVDPDSPFAKALSRWAPEVRGHLRQCLRRVGYQSHTWWECVLFGLLLHPQGMVWIQHPFHLTPPLGETHIERGIDLATRVPDTSYRSANKFHRAFRKSWGSERKPERPGPKPTEPRRPSAARQEFEQYVVERRKMGISPQSIGQDAEAGRLYRQARRDPTAELNAQAVRRVLRKHR